MFMSQLMELAKSAMKMPERLQDLGGSPNPRYVTKRRTHGPSKRLSPFDFETPRNPLKPGQVAS